MSPTVFVDICYSFSLIAILLIIFCCLAILCNEYLVPAVELLVTEFKIPEEVAGVTLLAMGSATPEIVLNTVSAIESASSLSLNAILGSATIAFGLIPALCMFSSPYSRVRLNIGPILREVFFYCLALFLFNSFIQSGSISTFEALGLVSVYIVYISIVIGLFICKRGSSNSESKEEEDKEQNDPMIELTTKDENQYNRNQKPPEVSALRKATEDFFRSIWNFIRRIVTLVFSSTIPSIHPEGRIGCGLPAHGCTFGRAILSLMTCMAYVASMSIVIVYCGQQLVQYAGMESGTLGGTLVALGAEIPDMISSTAMARSGYTDAALANAIGSQVINVTLAAGLPLLCSCLLSNGGIFQLAGEVSSLSLLTFLLSIVIATYLLTILPVMQWIKGSLSIEASLKRSGSLALFIVFCSAHLVFISQNEMNSGFDLMEILSKIWGGTSAQVSDHEGVV